MAVYNLTTEQITKLQTKVQDYVRARTLFETLPQIPVGGDWLSYYRYHFNDQPMSVHVGDALSPHVDSQSPPLQYSDKKMHVFQVSSEIPDDQLSVQGFDQIARNNEFQMDNLLDNIDTTMFRGNVQNGDTGSGLMNGATTEAIADATIQTNGDFLNLVAEMIKAVPHRYFTLTGGAFNLYIMRGLYLQLIKNKNATSLMNEFQSVYDSFGLKPGMARSSVPYLNDIFVTDKLYVTPAAAAQYAMLVIPHPRVCGVLVGHMPRVHKQIPLDYALRINWSAALAAHVFDANGVIKTDALTTDYY